MPFKKGQSGNPGGLKSGTRHASTVIKQKFFDAFDKSGGLKGLLEWVNESNKNRTEFYKLLVSLFPKEIEGPGDNGEFVLKVEISNENNSSQESGNRIGEYFTV